MSEIVLIRPGSTEFDEQHRIQGSLDLPLTDRGKEQVKHVVEALQDMPLAVIYAAPSEPARATAVAVGAGLDVPVKELQGLRSLDQGLWQGMQIDDLCRKYPKVAKQWRDSPSTICPPQGETVSAALERARSAIAKPLKRKDNFAVVASEPLATLVRSIILDETPDFPGPISGGGQADLLEVLHVNGRAVPAGPAGSNSKKPAKANGNGRSRTESDAE